MTRDASTAERPSWAQVWEAVWTRFLDDAREPGRRERAPVAGPEPFVDSYRWPDGSWTHSG